LCINARTAKQVQIITGEGGNPAFDVFGTQETSPKQYVALKAALTDYSVFPSSPDRLANNQDGETAIWWNKTAFTLVGEDKVTQLSNTNSRVTAPWVELKTASGHTFFVISVHYANTTFGGSVAEHQAAAKLTLDFVNAHASPDSPVFVVGDLNEHFEKGTAPKATVADAAYCAFTSNGKLQNLYDMAKGTSPSKQCPTKTNPGPNYVNAGKDQLFGSPVDNLTASGWTQPANSGIYASASDHSPVYATVSFNPAAGGGITGGLAWPVSKSIWDKNKNDWLEGHTLISGTLTSPYVRGVADDLSVPSGTPVYSMMSGTVTKLNLCGEGDGMIIKSAVPGGTLYIAYGHGLNPRFTVGQTVQAGQQILDSNGVGCKVTGPHLHIDMSLNNSQHICPQDVFTAMAAGQTPDFQGLTAKGKPNCNRL
jgi:murein DD-endopeptidase MepM/ murein hydrolase activator NlpD